MRSNPLHLPLQLHPETVPTVSKPILGHERQHGTHFSPKSTVGNTKTLPLSCTIPPAKKRKTLAAFFLVGGKGGQSLDALCGNARSFPLGGDVDVGKPPKK